MRLRARVNGAVQPGVVAAALNWAKLTPGGSNINVLTSEKLTDMGNSATFYSVLVEVELATPDPAVKVKRNEDIATEFGRRGFGRCAHVYRIIAVFLTPRGRGSSDSLSLSSGYPCATAERPVPLRYLEFPIPLIC